jgi:cytochrome oxidase assembly protein ShyY1
MTKQNWSRIVLVSLFMVVALIATAALGVWQYSIAHRNDISEQVLQAPTQSLNKVSAIGEYVGEQNYGQLTSTSGQLQCEDFAWVTLDSQTPAWLVCPLLLDDNSKIAVVLGSATDMVIEDVLVNSEVNVTGRMQPAQDTSQLSPSYQPADMHSLEYLNTDDLVIRWMSDVRDGYVVATAVESFDEESAFERLDRISDSALVLPPVGIEIRNLFYAWQWWLFAAFAIFIWYRFVRDELRANLRESTLVQHLQEK